MNVKAVVLIFTVGRVIGMACDRRGTLDRSKETASFSIDMTVVKDYSTGKSFIDIEFLRDGLPFSDAQIRIDDQEVPSAGGGIYYVNDRNFPLSPGLNLMTLESEEDQYLKSVTFLLSDSFGITNVYPRNNPTADQVFVEWSSSEGATSYILAVATANYYQDGTVPFVKLLPEGDNFYWIPETTFEDAIGVPIDATYYIYLVAYNQGFGTYLGMGFPPPEGLPERTISDPFGKLRYGTVAPKDSIIVSF